MASQIHIRDINEDDFDDWLTLWNENNNDLSDPEVTEETWARLNNILFPVHGLVAEKNGKVIGFVHYILHPVTGHLHPACYMQDLYVSPDHRRQGIGKALITHLSLIGRREEWARMYWLAEGDNEDAQGLYKNTGLKLNFTFHVMPLV